MNDNLQASRRQYRIDLLKAFAIIGVVLYHSGNLANGYLGVEVFLVIAGYFFTREYLKESISDHFNPFSFLNKRIQRLWPPILAICLLCLMIGFFTMLPDDFENLGESVVASSVFANNALEAITTKNYWNIANNYKPLMHMWYVGVLMQAYVCFLIIFRVSDRFGRKVLQVIVYIMTVVSFLLFLLPTFTAGDKFYFVPFRAFELLMGACICLVIEKRKVSIPTKTANYLYWGLSVLLVAIMVVNIPLSGLTKLVLETVITAALLFVILNSKEVDNPVLQRIAYIGKISFSIFIVHQPIMAFTRYFFVGNIVDVPLIVDLTLTAVFACVFYIVFEKGSKIVIRKYGLNNLTKITITTCVALCALGGVIYLRAGVVRDVPELDVYTNSFHRGMHAEYVDVPYDWNKEFFSEKIHILVIGDSMARDWCNILNESEHSSEYEISYVFGSKIGPQYENRIKEADYIFYASLGDSTQCMPEYLRMYSGNTNFYVIGIKNFGESNGQIYQKRFSPNYFDSSIVMGQTSVNPQMSFEEQDIKQRQYWKEHYIDMIAPIRNADGSIPVFTDTNKFISADTEHLTKNGCIYYSQKLDLSFIK